MKRNPRNVTNNSQIEKETTKTSRKRPKNCVKVSQSVEKQFPCTECTHTFGSAASLRVHARVHGARAVYVCDACQQAFGSRPDLTRHKANACGYDSRLTCPHCGLRFLLASRLTSHLRRHSDEKPFQCDQCDVRCKWKCTLARHMQLHNDLKPFACSVCGKTFTQAGLIKPHMRVHTGEKPFQCPRCEQRFTHKHNMQRHLLRHGRTTHTTCEVYHKCFPRESRLKYDMRVHGSDPKPVNCQLCTKSFSLRQNVTRHYQRKHPNHTYGQTMTDASVATENWIKVIADRKED